MLLRILTVAFFLASAGLAHASEPRHAVVLVAPEVREHEELNTFVEELRRQNLDVFFLSKKIVQVAGHLREEIERGQIDEEGENSPPHLNEFSNEVLSVIPKLFEYNEIYVLSSNFLPIEMVRKDGIFAGDHIAISHEFEPENFAPVASSPNDRPVLSSYVIEAVIPMDPGFPRMDQDIVKVALNLEQYFPVELHFNSGLRRIKSVFNRDDIGVLHIDTHGAREGKAIQVSRDGTVMFAHDLPTKLQIPVVLLFGCDGVANKEAFGSVLRQRGAQAVISSFVKFVSFGITGDAEREKDVYEAFFNSVRKGESVGIALLRVHQIAQQDIAASGSRKTLTRLFFVLIGNQQLKFNIQRSSH
ncbi:MAG: hypothetical protein WAK07_12345 [Rhodomicrobium sp.]